MTFCYVLTGKRSADLVILIFLQFFLQIFLASPSKIVNTSSVHFLYVAKLRLS